AAARRARLGALVLSQEDPDVLLVALLLARPQEREHPLEAARAVEHGVAEVLREIAPGGVGRDAALAREGQEPGTLPVVARLLPRVDRALPQRAARVRHDQRRVVLQHRAESRALRA